MRDLLEVAVALIERKGRFFLQQRPEAATVFPGLWECPGGKVEAGETPEEALRRELMEELDWVPDRVQPLPPLLHSYETYAVRLHPFRCSGDAAPRAELAWGWFTADESLRLPLPAATRELFSRGVHVFTGHAH